METTALTTKEFIVKSRAIHGDIYTYNDTVYTIGTDKIIVTCKIHGDFIVIAKEHIRASRKAIGCPKCTKEKALETRANNFKMRANSIHNNKYDYSSVVYKGAKSKVTIICPHHGEFLQAPNDHLNGCGCRHCRTESIGWSDSKWQTAGETSKDFSGFKLYIVKIWDSEESFIKIGKTFREVSTRMGELSAYYSYKVLEVIEADAKTVCLLERKYQRMNSEYRYSPMLRFNGHTECFTKVIIDEGKIYEY